jgi:undecaprenyl-diphosphatase
MAIAVDLLLVSKRLGAAAVLLALAEGFCRLYMGVHYPTDVLGGFALGTATVLLLAPAALAVLVPLCQSVGRSAAGPLISAGRSSRGERAARRGQDDDRSGSSRPESGIAA